MANKIFKDKDNATGYGYRRVSRWIKVEYTIITSRHRLADYADKQEGALWLTYFRYNNKEYALNQFMSLVAPVILEDGSIIGGYDCTNWYNPLLLEIHPDGEYVRLWEETKLEEDN